MNVPIWASEIANAFWSDAGYREPFPRRLLGPIGVATPLSVVFPSRLTISDVQKRLRQLGINCNLEIANRTLKACLVARNGHGFIFIDGTDPDNEQRFSLAHELAHFLRDYLYPRRRIQKRLGSATLDVLDGNRPPTQDERMRSVLAQTPIGYHFHLMERDGEQRSHGPIADAEESADRLAYELLAPADQVAAVMSSCNRPPDCSAIADLLRDYFGLPERQAALYSGLLVPRSNQVDPLLLRLRGVS